MLQMSVLRIIFYRIQTRLTGRLYRKRLLDNTEKRDLGIFDKFFLLCSRIFGFLYFQFRWNLEKYRFYKFKRRSKLKEYTAVNEILSASKNIIFLLIATILVFSLGDIAVNVLAQRLATVQGFQNVAMLFGNINLPSNDFIASFLGVCIGAISAVLGMIIALYAIGIQLSAQSYSSEVSDYLNSEIVADLYFKILVFTNLVAITLLIKIIILPSTPAIFGFILVFCLVTVCFLGLIIFKSHYLSVLKPKFLFERIGKEIKEDIQLVSNTNSYETKSWNIVNNARKRVLKNVKLLEQLFQDLLNDPRNHPDVIYAPIILGYVLSIYVEKKRYINKSNNWWFYNTQSLVKNNTESAFLIKTNFEIRGMGPLFQEEQNFSWFEDRILEILSKIEVQGNDKNQLLLYVIQAYQQILGRDFSYTERKKLKGAYANQEIATFEKFFSAFLSLFEKVDLSETYFVSYINAYFNIGLTVIEGSSRVNLKKVISKFYDNKNDLFPKGVVLPTIQYEEINDYWDRVKLELTAEKNIVTPKNHLEEEILTSVKEKEEKLFSNYFQQLLNRQGELIKKFSEQEKTDAVVELVKMRLTWLTRLLYLKKDVQAEEYSDYISKLLPSFLTFTSENILEHEFLDSLERLIFTTVLGNTKKTFSALLLLFFTALQKALQGEKDLNEIIFKSRSILVIGGFVYLYSEFNQNKELLKIYSRALDIYYDQERIVTTLDTLKDIKGMGDINLTTQIIFRESSRYHNWYMSIYHKILSLPKKYGPVRHYSGLQPLADHPSDFVSRISHYITNVEEESEEEFVEWIKRRKKVENLLNLLVNIQNAKE